MGLCLLGCERSIATPLVEITELTPREIEPGDRLEVHGSGFPQGRAGRVTLEGTVFRPGEPPIRNVTIDLEARVGAPNRLEVAIRDALAEKFCGRGDRAVHATFRGDVQVAFASDVAGALPLVGVLRGTTIDVIPSSTRASVVEARVAEGARVLSFLGLLPGVPSPRGLPVEQVRPGSLAEAAGIQVGHVLASADGVHVLSVGDVIPASSRAIELTVRLDDSGTEATKTLSLLEYSSERVPVEYVPALVLVSVALVVLLLLVLPGPQWLAAVEMRIASRLRQTTARDLFVALVGTGGHAALSAITSAVAVAFAVTPYIVGREVDGVALLAASATMLVWSRMAGKRATLASLRLLATATLATVAMAGAMVLAIGQVGAIELAEIVRLQGGMPWQFHAARHPSCALLSAVYAAAIVAVLRLRDDDRPARSALLERGGLLLASALGVTMFFGGWQLPGTMEARAYGLVLVSGLLFVVKTWGFAALLLALSRITPNLKPPHVHSLILKRLLPGLIIGGAAVGISRRIVPSAAVETTFGATLVVVAAVMIVRIGAGIRGALARPEPHASPFL